jgi:glycosyltransferase involved in cell wall biosynthesis
VSGADGRFSVVIPAYDAAATIADAVGSALAQTLPPHEVIVCDDGSTDDLAAALEPYLDRITVLRKANGGGASALNAAARAASGEFVAILDADDAYLPGRLAALARLAADRPELDLLVTNSLLERDSAAVGLHLGPTNPFPAEDQPTALLRRCFILAPAVRRSRLLEVGGFDETLRIAYDWDCWLRIILAGGKAGLVDEPLHRYRIRADSLAASRLASLRERVVFLERNRSNPALSGEMSRALAEAVGYHRRRLMLAEADIALLERRPDARRRAWSVAAATGVHPRTRAVSAAAAVAPRLVGLRMARRAVERGRSPAIRPYSYGT